ncbi:hypothetical protein LWI29_030977 [Acer saccharum]|uniref:Uncharacterized protein n=1 Tax=Acer saccharum TaxID=4024 RepID=A0AA39SVH1_ACESA|nr:hypothetical protein LWI29_030977 [Acer saccharum]
MEIDPRTYSEENSGSQSDDELEESSSIAKEKSGLYFGLHFAILDYILDCMLDYIFDFYHCVIEFDRMRDLIAEEKTSSQELRLLRLGEHTIGDDSSYNILRGEKHTESQDLSMFPLSLVLKATQNFFDENKLGEGGFGSVYKVIIMRC